MRSRPTASRDEVADVAAADMELADTLDNLDGADSYADWILTQVEPHLGPDVLEVGAGHGTSAEMLSAKPRDLTQGKPAVGNAAVPG